MVIILWPWSYRRNVPPKRRLTFNGLHASYRRRQSYSIESVVDKRHCLQSLACNTCWERHQWKQKADGQIKIQDSRCCDRVLNGVPSENKFRFRGLRLRFCEGCFILCKERIQPYRCNSVTSQEVNSHSRFGKFLGASGISIDGVIVFACGCIIHHIKISFRVSSKLKKNYPCNRSWRPIGLLDAEAPSLFGQWAHRWRWGCQPYVPADCHLPARRFLLLISIRGWVDPRAVVLLEGLRQLKNPWIDPASFRLVA
jgi:hypothetical protein